MAAPSRSTLTVTGSQARFARHAGMDRSHVAAIEHGEFNLSIVKIAVGLDTKASALFALAKL